MNSNKPLEALPSKTIQADAKRMRWLLSGNGYFMEEQMLCGHGPCTEDEQDLARKLIDEQMVWESGRIK